MVLITKEGSDKFLSEDQTLVESVEDHYQCTKFQILAKRVPVVIISEKYIGFHDCPLKARFGGIVDL